MIARLYLNNNTSSSKSVVYYTEGNSYYSFVLTSVGAIAGTSGSSGSSGSSGIDGPTGPTGAGFNTVANYGTNRLLVSDNTASGATAQSNLTFDGTNLSLTGNYYINSASPTGLNSGSSPYYILSIDKSLGSAAYFDYSVSNTSTGAYRSGTVMTIWNGTNSTYTDTSTPDLGASTLGIEFSTDINGANLRLIATVTTGTWSVRIGARVI
jgi:hypothetical protein